MTKKHSIAAACLILLALLGISGWEKASALTPTPTPTAPIICPQIALSVNPVVSPASALTQVVTMRAGGGGLYKFTVFVRDSAGNLLSSPSSTPSGGQTTITINLQPGVTHILTVSVNGEVGCTQNGTPTAFIFTTTSKTVDSNGNPLVIVQQATATNTPTPTPTNTPVVTTPPPGGLRVQLQNGGADNNQQSQFRFKIVNASGTAQSNISIRLYIQLDGTQPISKYKLEKYWDQSGVVNISAPVQASGNIYYFTFSFGATSLAAGASWEFQGALHLSDWSNNFNGTNDWWHTGYATGALPTTFTNTNNFPAYLGTSLVWGSTP